MLDAVDPSIHELGDRLLAEAVRRDPGTRRMGGVDRPPSSVRRPARREVADVPVDPVTDELHPAVATRRLEYDRVHELVRLDLFGEVPQVTLRPGHVAAGPDDGGQILAVVDPACVGG